MCGVDQGAHLAQRLQSMHPGLGLLTCRGPICIPGCSVVPRKIDVKPDGGWTCASEPRDEFGQGGVDGEPVEMDDGRVGGSGSLAVLAVEGLLVGGFGPSCDLGGIKFAEAGQTRSVGPDRSGFGTAHPAPHPYGRHAGSSCRPPESDRNQRAIASLL